MKEWKIANYVTIALAVIRNPTQFACLEYAEQPTKVLYLILENVHGTCNS